MATPQVTSDTFICGSCQKYFNNLVTFLEHKRSTSCGVTVQFSSEEAQSGSITVLTEAPENQGAQTSSNDNQPIKIVKKRGRPKKDANQPSSTTTAVSTPPLADHKTATIGAVTNDEPTD